jgi:SPP1 family predicted phage head-tail adaptor
MIEQMRGRITIQKSTTENDKYGNHTLIWEDYYKCSAYVNNLSGTEYWAASEVNAQDEVNFIIRYCKKVAVLTSDHYRIIFRGSIYDISFVDNVQYADKTMKLRAKKVAR